LLTRVICVKVNLRLLNGMEYVIPANLLNIYIFVILIIGLGWEGCIQGAEGVEVILLSLLMVPGFACLDDLRVNYSWVFQTCSHSLASSFSAYC